MSFDTLIEMGEIGEQTVTVEFDYTPGFRGSLNEPSEPSEIEITAVTFRGIDIKPDCCAGLIDQLEQEAWECLANAQESAQEDRAEYLRDLLEAA